MNFVYLFLFGCVKIKYCCGGDIVVILWSFIMYGVLNGVCGKKDCEILVSGCGEYI